MSNILFKYGEERFGRYESSSTNLLFELIKFLVPYYQYKLIRNRILCIKYTVFCSLIYFVILFPIKLINSAHLRRVLNNNNTFWINEND